MNLNSISAGHFPMATGAELPLLRPSSSDSAEAALADRALVDRVLGGDTQAFAGIVQRWQGPLINMAWRYCRDRGRAEEMAQEALIRAWRGLGQWRRESSFSTWLFSVAANVYRTELKRIPSVNLPLDKTTEPSSPFMRAVYALPDKYREPLILYYFHEMDLDRKSVV